MQAEQNIQQEANKHYGYRFDDALRALIAVVDMDSDSAEHEGETCDYDRAIERLQEIPLSFEKLITDRRHETITWEILLGTGGPADRVVVVTDYNGAIESAEYQFQDWFQPWTAAEDQDEDLVRRFAEIVGYYEPQD